ncbi:MAG: DNA-binding transcriptional regulator KdgR [Ktedonobacteraceae bacterium]
MTDERKTEVGVLDKIIAILHTFTQGSTVLSPQDISARTRLPLPTVYRLCQAMSEHGMLEKEGQHFRLGITLMHLGALVAEGIDLRGQTLPHLRWLNEQTGENAELHVRHGEIRIVLETVRSSHSLRPFAAVGAPLPLHLGAAGKVLLAWLPPAERDALIHISATRFASTQAIDRSALTKQLEQIQHDGWAVSDAERAPGVAAIAAPMFDVQGSIAGAIALTAPSIRLSAKQRQLFIPLVYEAAHRASVDLGYTGPTHLGKDSLRTTRNVF